MVKICEYWPKLELNSMEESLYLLITNIECKHIIPCALIVTAIFCPERNFRLRQTIIARIIIARKLPRPIDSTPTRNRRREFYGALGRSTDRCAWRCG